MMRALTRLGTLVGKAGFNEDQPRVSGGNGRDSGRWRNVEGYAQERQPDIGDNGGPSLDPPKDPSVDRSAKIKAAKQLAKMIASQLLRRAGPVGVAIELGSELYSEWPSIRSYQDEPKSLMELQEQAGKNRPGYDDHHIVEQGAESREGFPRADIDGAGNVVSIPRYKHHEITGWYATRNAEFGNLSPRDYLRGRSWAEHMELGRDALRRFKVLK